MKNADRSTAKAERANTVSDNSNVIELSQKKPQHPGNDLATIQDILFGEYLRDNNNKLAQLQSDSEKSLNQLSEQVESKLVEMNSVLDKKFGELQDSIAQGQDVHAKELKTSDDRFVQATTALEVKLNADAKASQQQQASLEAGIADVKAELCDAIKTTREHLLDQLNVALVDMDEKKLDRANLSEMFNVVANNLSTSTDSGRAASGEQTTKSKRGNRG